MGLKPCVDLHDDVRYQSEAVVAPMALQEHHKRRVRRATMKDASLTVDGEPIDGFSKELRKGFTVCVMGGKHPAFDCLPTTIRVTQP